jgi:hypothetical protein
MVGGISMEKEFRQIIREEVKDLLENIEYSITLIDCKTNKCIYYIDTLKFIPFIGMTLKFQEEERTKNRSIKYNFIVKVVNVIWEEKEKCSYDEDDNEEFNVEVEIISKEEY